MSVYDTANRLAREIKNTDEYKSYQEIREKILEDESTRDMLQEYMEHQMKVQSKRMSGEEITESEKQEAERLENLIDINSRAKKYIQAEYQMSQMLNDLQNILFGDLEIGILKEDDDEKADPAADE